MQRTWRIVPHDSGRIEQLMRSSGLPAVVAQILGQPRCLPCRGGQSVSGHQVDGAARSASSCRASPRRPICWSQAIQDKTPIVIYGDYDCDGMTGTAILVNGLRLLGADVSYHVPNRLEDGYGLNEDAIANWPIAASKIIVSVDCGITSVELRRAVQGAGRQADHHRPSHDRRATSRCRRGSCIRDCRARPIRLDNCVAPASRSNWRGRFAKRCAAAKRSPSRCVVT